MPAEEICPTNLVWLGMQAKEVPHAAVGNTWASEFDSQQEAQDHEDVWRQFNGVCVCLHASFLPAFNVTDTQNWNNGGLYRSSNQSVLHALRD